MNGEVGRREARHCALKCGEDGLSGVVVPADLGHAPYSLTIGGYVVDFAMLSARVCLTGLIYLGGSDTLWAPQLNWQTASQKGVATSQQITVKIRDGRTGLPIWLASPYVFLGKTDPARYMDSYRRTKLWGDAKVDVSGTSPREVRVWIDFIHRDCRHPEGEHGYSMFDFAGNILRGTPTYPIDQILSTGIVAPNLCSSKTQRPEAGVLTIYVVPATFKELWDS